MQIYQKTPTALNLSLKFPFGFMALTPQSFKSQVTSLKNTHYPLAVRQAASEAFL